MIQIRYVTEDDSLYWFTLDRHMAESEFLLKVRDRRGYIINDSDTPVGIMRYHLFWDNTPFLTLIYLEETHRKKGFGRQAMQFWESEMAALGYGMVMTSTQSDEQAQHFYRKLGYKDSGCLILDNAPYKQPLELLMVKTLPLQNED